MFFTLDSERKFNIDIIKKMNISQEDMERITGIVNHAYWLAHQEMASGRTFERIFDLLIKDNKELQGKFFQLWREVYVQELNKYPFEDEEDDEEEGDIE